MKLKITSILLLTAVIFAVGIYYYTNLLGVQQVDYAIANSFETITPMPDYNKIFSESKRSKSITKQPNTTTDSFKADLSVLPTTSPISSVKSWSDISGMTGAKYAYGSDKESDRSMSPAGGMLMPISRSGNRISGDNSTVSGGWALTAMNNTQMSLMINSTNNTILGDPDDPDDTWNGGPSPEGAPVGGGMMVLLIMAVGYGFFRFRK